MPLADISRASRIGIQYLEALERNEFEALPGPRAFGKLYIRAYAEILGFDPAPLIAEYDEERYKRIRAARKQEEEEVPVEPEAEPEAEAVIEVVEDPPPPRVWPRRVALGAAGLLILTLGLWTASIFSESPSPIVEPPQKVAHEDAVVGTIPVLEPQLEIVPEKIAIVAESHLSVTDHGVGRGVRNHRLVDASMKFEEGQVAWFATRVTGGKQGETIQHVWMLEGGWVQTVELPLGGAHWRTRSRKTLWGVGNWSVEARDMDGNVLARSEFSCVPRGRRLSATKM